MLLAFLNTFRSDIARVRVRHYVLHITRQRHFDRAQKERIYYILIILCSILLSVHSAMFKGSPDLMF